MRAILNANYMAKRLEKSYPVLYKGNNGTCAHEFILDIRSLKDTAGEKAYTGLLMLVLHVVIMMPYDVNFSGFFPWLGSRLIQGFVANFIGLRCQCG